MTEQEWFAATDPRKPLEECSDRIGVRRQRLISLAVCRTLPADLLGDKWSYWLATVESFAERPTVKVSAGTVRGRTLTSGRLADTNFPTRYRADAALHQALIGNVSACLVNVGIFRNTCDQIRFAFADSELAALVRDIIGNPFRPVAFDHRWRTSTAVQLARTMYETRDFGPMPILADALQDAGCENADILEHCRDPNGVHVRGCWVVDRILGKS